MSMIEPAQQPSAVRAQGPVAAPPPSTPSRREIQELWLALSRQPWRTVVLVPADRRGSSEAAALALAEVGRRLRPVPVNALVAPRLDYDSTAQVVRRLAALRGSGGAEQLVVSIPSVVAEPLGVAAAREADLVVLCLELGLTSLAGARQTIELIGLDRIAGCLLLT